MTDKMPRIYISGPMTGYPDYNYPAFENAAQFLRSRGYEVESPHENPAPVEKMEEHEMWEYYMVLCKKQIDKCDMIVLLQGWPESTGARKELAWAIERGMKVLFLRVSPWGKGHQLYYMSKPDEEVETT